MIRLYIFTAVLGVGLISTSLAAMAQDAYGGIYGNSRNTESVRQ
jgi:hypothetical protein